MSDKDDHRAPLVVQARALSSGTMGNLTDLNRYDELDAVQVEFVEFCEENEKHYQSWAAAWRDYAMLKGYGKMEKVTK